MSVPAVRENEPELCPPRAMLESYARGGRDPQIAGHVACCERCAWIVAELMEANPVPSSSEIIDISPRTGWLHRCLQALKAGIKRLTGK